MNIPMLTPDEYKAMDKIRIEYMHKLADILEPLLREVFPNLKIEIPKHLEGASSGIQAVFLLCNSYGFYKESNRFGTF